MTRTPRIRLAVAVLTAVSALPTPSLPAQVDQPPAPNGTWSTGFGAGPSYRAAYGMALEDAVVKVKGVAVARGLAMRSRLAVVANHKDGDQEGWFDGESRHETEWVQQQLAGFLSQPEVIEKKRGDDGHWEVTVKALVATLDRASGPCVVDLDDGGLTKWTLERFEETNPDAPVSRQTGEIQSFSIADHLRATRLVKIAAKGAGVAVAAGSAAKEREKQGHQLVASHRIQIRWQPIRLVSQIDKPNKARPTAGPRPEFLFSASVDVRLAIEDLVENIALLDEAFTVTEDVSASPMPVNQTADLLTSLERKAKVAVAERVFFALRPPVVQRKWQDEGDGKPWLVEIAVARNLLEGATGFELGQRGSLADPSWLRVCGATLVRGDAQSCTFRLDGVDDPARIEPSVTELHLLRNR
jgi:hypothetical protein